MITNKRNINGVECGILRFLFTWGLVVDITETGEGEIFEYRFCFEHYEDALESLNSWNGEGLPGGPWIKQKGLVNSVPTDRLNPKLSAF